MSYEVIETSVDDGSPMEIYHFQQAGGLSYTYNSGDVIVSYQGVSYTPEALNRNEIVVNGHTSESPLNVKVPSSNPLALSHVKTVPFSKISLTIHRFHRGDVVNGVIDPAEVILVWKGTVKSVSWEGSIATIECGLLSSALQRQGPTKMYQRLCRHMLYDDQCTVAEDAHKVSGLVTIPDPEKPTELTMAEAAGEPAGKLTAGYARLGANEYRTIILHSGASITLASAFPSLQTGESLTLFAGCDRSIATCNTTFSNVENYGGFPYIPTKNPFITGF